MPGHQTNMKCSVRGKIKCMYQSKVVHSISAKRNDQQYKVVASEEMSADFARYTNEFDMSISEKFDGTCCKLAGYHGRPWLWARHDIKPHKQADKRFKAYQQLKNEHILKNGNEEKYPDFIWDRENDFKEAPDDWIPASGVENDGPDDIGHMVGWVPVDPSLRQHLWHLSAVNLNDGLALFLKDSPTTDEPIRIEVDKIENYYDKTFELIGTHVNANPYKLGTKKNPIHVLVQHGEFVMKDFPNMEKAVTHGDLAEWFDQNINGHIEGVVWHADDGKMFKLHRHHLNLKWPVDELRLCSRAVCINMENYEDDSGHNKNVLFEKLKSVHGKRYVSVSELSEETFENS